MSLNLTNLDNLFRDFGQRYGQSTPTETTDDRGNEMYNLKCKIPRGELVRLLAQAGLEVAKYANGEYELVRSVQSLKEEIDRHVGEQLEAN